MDHVADLSKQLETAGVTYEIEVYSGAPHAFTVFDSDRYRKVADEKSWATFREFLKTNLGSSRNKGEPGYQRTAGIFL